MLTLAAAAIGNGLAAAQEAAKGPDRPAGESPLEDFDDSQGYPTQQALRDLLVAVPGHRAEIGRASKWERPICRFSGLLRLGIAWPAGSALRFSIVDPDRLQVHVWSGTQGVTVRYYPDFHQTWALYATTREGPSPRPAKYALGATAGDRYRRAGWGSVQLQHQGGNLVLTRGDLPLASVPLAGPPTEVFIEGGGLVRGLAVVPSPWLPARGEGRGAWGREEGEKGRRGEAEKRTTGERAGSVSPSPLLPFPSSSPVAPAAVRVLLPADWAWDTKLPDKVALKKLPDGRLTLAAGEKTQQGQAAIAIGNPGLAAFSFDVEDPEPGTGVFLGDAQGRHLCRLGFFRHRETGQVTFDLLSPYSSDTEKSYDIQRQVVPFAARRQWYRIVAGAGMFICWTSADGVHWSQIGPTSLDGEGACEQVGLYCLPGQKPRSITLCSLEVRRLEPLHSAAPAEVQKQVGNLAKFESLEKWEAEVARSAPASVPADVWWRACAVKTLGDGPKASLAQPLFDRLRRAVYASAADADSCLRFAEEASMFYPQGDWSSMDRLMAQLPPLGMALVRHKHPTPFTALHRSMLNWPLWPNRRLPVYPDDLLRHELTSRLGEGRWGEVQDLCRRLAYFNHTGGPREGEQPPWSPHAEYLVHWAEAVAAQHLPKPKGAQPVAGRLGLGRHPLVDSPTREGFSTISELRAAMGNESYREAAQAITSATGFDRMGLVPDWSDPWLSTSLPVAVGALVRDRPALAKSIQEAAAAIGPLRWRQAANSGNPAAVEAVACQFPGTELAAAAYRWLGDRELSMGRFVEAMAWYRRSYSSASPADRELLTARARLLGALRGRDVGQAPRTPVQFGNTQYSPAEFEQMIEQLRQARARGVESRESRVESKESRVKTLSLSSQLSTLDSQLSTLLLRPGRFEARPWARVEGCGVKRPPGYPDRDVDWAGRQTSVLVTESQMIVNNRIEQMAFELASGRQQWANRLAVEEGKQQWASLPMQPAALGGKVYCRRLTDDGPELTCVDPEDGRLLWQAAPDSAVVSEPLFVGDRLFVLSATADPGSKIALGLVGLDAATGRIRSRVPLVEFRDLWRGQLPCQAAVVEEKIVAAVGGCVLCCDVAGRVHWMRRQVWIPQSSFEYSSGREWIDQAYSPPLVEEGLVFAAQPGVWAVECIELEGGRLRWRQALGGLTRLLGRARGRLVAETAGGLVGLDSESGRPLWSLEVRDRLETLLCGPQGPVLCVYLGPKKDASVPRPILMDWIDPQTGRRLGRSALKPPSSTESWLKPLIAAEGRLWGFWGSLKEPAQRDILELVRVGEPDEGPEGP